MSQIITQSLKLRAWNNKEIFYSLRRTFKDDKDDKEYARRSGGVRKNRTIPNDDFDDKRAILPVLQLNEHILPHFEKVIRREDYFDEILKSTEPNSGKLAMFVKKLNAPAQPDLSHLYSIGTVVSYNKWPLNDSIGNFITLRAHQRIKRLNHITVLPNIDENINEFDQNINIGFNNTKITNAHVQYLSEQNDVQRSPEIKTLTSQILDLIRKLQPYFPYNSLKNRLNSRSLSPILLSYCPSDFSILSDPSRLQKLLDENDINQRLRKTIKLLKEELNFFITAQNLNRQATETEIRDAHVFNLLRLKNIIDSSINNINGVKNENFRTHPIFNTGSKPDSAFEKKIKERLKNLVIPEITENVIKEELARISHIDKISAEYGLVQSYLDNLTLVPWGIYKSGQTSLSEAKIILNNDHYGLFDVKSTILEHLAINSRSTGMRGRIICLVGPPGVGKTSIAKSIARALNRKYVRVSVGGIDDAAEIKGHRRTYIGALPGKIIKGLQLSSCMDPVFCIDEVDKLVRGHRGDPSGALLEAFDPEQNSAFLDHYLDVPVDLSKILFICTANSTSTIPLPLLDRMDVIKITGYTSEEKLAIINDHLIPSIISEFNISELMGKNISISKEVLQRLSDEYFLEPGVRNARKCLEKLVRKAVMKLDLENMDNIAIDLANLEEYAGQPEIPIRRPKDEGVVGIVTGLSAVDSYVTGFTMDIECDFVPHASKTNTDCMATGLAGKALSESSLVAVAVAKKYLATIDSDNKSLENNLVRVHFLEGGIQKDGPSAGVGIFCAVMSQALNIPVSRNLAMTGEITLKGNVMAVGGIREKVTAAIRSGIKNVILPTENIPKFKELVDPIRSKVTPFFVSNIDELMRVVFPTVFQNKSVVDQEISGQKINFEPQVTE